MISEKQILPGDLMIISARYGGGTFLVQTLGDYDQCSFVTNNGDLVIIIESIRRWSGNLGSEFVRVLVSNSETNGASFGWIRVFELTSMS